tara:strand:+ start:414 stop:620 length:207 start_codon:yes stop_codon:yes gene_type:complete
LKLLIIGLIKFYQKGISPFLPSICKYQPTCSEYALQAINKFGVLKGTWLAFFRILRCNPWAKGGADYV